MKKIYLGTNLKMYKTIQQTVDYLKGLQSYAQDIDRDKVTVFAIPSFTALDQASSLIFEKKILLGAQNMCWEEKGQFTGEISPCMLQEIGIDIVEIGHSERRHVMGENDFDENKKVLSALSHGFIALLCIGETLKQKQYDLCDEVLSTQLKIGLHNINDSDLNRIWIAYEPVWAIGEKGSPSSPEYANQKHAVIRSVLEKLFPKKAGEIPILYGGSVNINNCEGYAAMPEINGLFVGRAAWDEKNFNTLIRSVLPVFYRK